MNGLARMPSERTGKVRPEDLAKLFVEDVKSRGLHVAELFVK